MRALLIAAAVAALTSSAAQAEDTWIAICFGQDAQYTQTVGGPGFFHVGNGDRTYDTQKLLQSFYDGKTVCATPDPKAPRASSGVAEVCANKDTKMISVMPLTTGMPKPVTPLNASPYCKARIDVLN
jgi:hypothetical protein